VAFVYPSGLVDKVKERWSRYHGPRKVRIVASGPKMKPPRKPVEQIEPGLLDTLPFPSDPTLLALLEALYHSSFLLEEGRRISLRVTYLPQNMPSAEKDRILNHQGSITCLQSERSLSPSELLRLAPAVDSSQSMILVEESQHRSDATSQPLVVWGLLHLGSEWSDLVSGRSSAASSPPKTLTVSTAAPGELVISSTGHVLLRLRNGMIADGPSVELDDGAIGAFLRPAAQALYVDACSHLKRTRFAENDSNEHPYQVYYSTLLNILRRTDERHHGGSYVIVPDELIPLDARLTDRISVKYLVDTDDPNAVYWASQRMEHLRQKIRDFEAFVSSLSGVDGAVVLTKRLRVIGFGAEITATSPSLSSVRQAADASGKIGRDVPITAFGTRHRSAFRFCSSLEDALCFVVSQDGQVKAVKRVGPQVVIWNDVVSREQVL
jgi:hypothetical protein